MNKIILKKLNNSLISVVPITIIILVLNFSLPDRMTNPSLFKFLIGAVFLIVGMVLYSLGSETALEPIGELIGNRITSTKRVWLILLVGFVIGFIVTIAEPDLIVLGTQLGSIKWILIITIAFGVGMFLVLALARILKKIQLKVVLIVLYGILFLIACFTHFSFIPLAFDSGGVTTGPVTVPFILAIGVGVASVMGGKNKKEDSFGIVAICSIGPIIAVLLLCLIFKPNIDSSISVDQANSFSEVLVQYGLSAFEFFKDVLIALLPIISFFLIINFLLIKIPKKRLIKILIGIIYTFVGLSLFLLGANLGFMGTGLQLGERIASLEYNGVLVPICMAIGCVLVLAEPAVIVLGKQVEDISNGNIRKVTIIISLCIAMAFAVGLSMLRILFKFSIWYFIIPGYAIAITLTFFSPKVFTAIAFDSGGVVSGPMTTAFMLPLAIGVTSVVSGSSAILTDAYGIVGLVALMPLIVIQVLGIVTTQKQKRQKVFIPKNVLELFEGNVIELNYTKK